MNISIIVPVYNVEPYIERCIRSIMNQTFTEGVECILINDCTPDNSIRIVQQLINEYKGNIQFRILSNEHNQGIASVRNIGLQAAKGTYIQYIDSDDYVEPDMLETLYKKACGSSSDILVYDYYCENKNQTIIKKQQAVASPNECVSLLLKNEIPGYLWNKLLKKDFLLEKHIHFFEGVNMWEDLIVLLLCYLSEPKINYLPYAGYHYIQYNPNSIVSDITIAQVNNKIKACQIVEKILKDKGVYEKYKLDFTCLIMEAKNNFILTKNLRNYKRWKELWPEVNKWIWKINKRWDIRLIYWLAAIRCYCISRFIFRTKEKIKNFYVSIRK